MCRNCRFLPKRESDRHRTNQKGRNHCPSCRLGDTLGPPCVFHIQGRRRTELPKPHHGYRHLPAGFPGWAGSQSDPERTDRKRIPPNTFHPRGCNPWGERNPPSLRRRIPKRMLRNRPPNPEFPSSGLQNSFEGPRSFPGLRLCRHRNNHSDRFDPTHNSNRSRPLLRSRQYPVPRENR